MPVVTEWVPGHNNPYVFRGNGGALSDQARLLIANLIWHVGHNDQLRVAAVAAVRAARSASGDTKSASGDTKGDDAARRSAAISNHVAVAHLLGITDQLAYRVAANMEAKGWKWTRNRHGVRPAKHTNWGPKARSDTEPASGGQRDDCNVGYLPKLPDPIDDDVLDSDDTSDGTNALATGSNRPQRSTQIQRWKEHPNYRPAMTHAELSTFWITAGLPAYRWPDFLAWFSTKVKSGASANINCSFHWLIEFSTSLSKTIMSRTAASIHALVPALGLPSDLVRVIDVVSVDAASTLPIIAVHTSYEGKLICSVVGCPTLGSLPVGSSKLASGSRNNQLASGSRNNQLASGSSRNRPKDLFRTHGAPKLIELVHRSEECMHIHRDDRVMRLAMTMADGAIQGPGSVQFEEEEAKVDNRLTRHVGVCQFHRLDNAGNSTDRHFRETELFDTLLRLIRKNFGFGMGVLILRAVARKFEALAQELEQSAREVASAALGQGNPRKAKRLENESKAKVAHAACLRRAGWTTYRRPLAPKADGTRKVVWQSHSRRRLFDMFALVFWGLQVRMVEVREAATVAAERRSLTSHAVISDRIGERSAQMKIWRALGRSLLDVHLLVFNMGRSDFRAKHTSAAALTMQSTESSSIETQAHCMDVCAAMFWSLAALLDLRAIVRLLENLLMPTKYSRPFWKKNVVWATAKTLMAHKAWRHFPLLTKHLPHILLGGSLQGVDLHSTVFQEPSSKGKTAAGVGAGVNKTAAGVTHTNPFLERRKQRFAEVSNALESLIEWVKLERKNFESRVLRTPASRRPLATRRSEKMKSEQDIHDAEHTLQCHVIKGQDVGNCPEPDADAIDTQQPLATGLTGGRCLVPAAQANIDTGSPYAASGAKEDRRTQGLKRTRHEIDIHDDNVLDEAAYLDKECATFFRIEPAEPNCDASQVSNPTRDILKHTNRLQAEHVSAAGEDVSAVGEEDGSEDESSESDEDGPSRPSGPASSNKPNNARSRVSNEFWVIAKRKCGQILIKKWSTWRSHWEHGVISDFPRREKALNHYSRVFGGGVLATGNASADMDTWRQSLEAIFDEFDGHLWGSQIDEGLVARCMRDIPDEVLQCITFREFCDQYKRFRSWVSGFRSGALGREILTLVGCLVIKETVGEQGRAIGHCQQGQQGQLASGSSGDTIGDGTAGHWQQQGSVAFWTDAGCIVEATDHTFIPEVGTYVHVKKQGRCRVHEVKTRVCNTRLYRWVMSTPYLDIHALKVWHVVRAYHRCTMLSTPSESVAESVGSVLADAATRGSGRPNDVSFFVQSMVVRMAKLQGHGDEEGILGDALNVHFGAEGPESWHVRVAKRSEQKSATGDGGAALRRAVIRRQIRAQACQPWVQSTLLDVARSRQQKFCKTLPTPSKFMLSASGYVGRLATGNKARKRRVKDRRAAVQAAKDFANPSSLSERLWGIVRVSVEALSRHNWRDTT